MTVFLRYLLIIFFAFGISSAGFSQDNETTPPVAYGGSGVPLFSMPGYTELKRQAERLARLRRLDPALELLRALEAQFPQNGTLYADKAGILMAKGEVDAAVEALSKAQEHGLFGLDQFLRRPIFDSVRQREDFIKIFEASKNNQPFKAHEATPSGITEKTAIVTSQNTYWDKRHQLLRSEFLIPDHLESELVSNGIPQITDKLLDLYYSGQGAGNVGDLYDNRDQGHSELDLSKFPQVTRVQFGEGAGIASPGRPPGFNTHFDSNLVVVGNSSTAMTGPQWRSLPRYMITHQGSIARLYQHYITNRLYVFPEHRDHDPEGGSIDNPEGKGYGDLFPANTPYYLISQGSSGSDQAILEAVFQILAAFQPETKKRLIELNMIAPAIQWAFRHGIKGAEGEEGYLSPRAHPSVYRAQDLDVMEMIRKANEMSADDIPPVVKLKVVNESRPKGVTGVPAPGLSERLFDTPSAIARIWRSIAPVKFMTISAEGTKDPNEKPLEYKWVVLRGNPKSVNIRPKDDNNSVVDIRISLSPRAPIPDRPEISSDRVDIAVFAWNGVHYSAPSFVSVVYPPTEAWSFERNTDGGIRVRSINYSPQETADIYVDPALYFHRNWTDIFQYESDGKLAGWTRVREDGETDFNIRGEKILKLDSRGRAIQTEIVRYQPTRRGDNPVSELLEIPTEKFVEYQYSGDADFIGERIADE